MRVLAIGGNGEYGLPTVKALIGLNEVDEVVIAARSLEHAQVASEACGSKVGAVRVDATDENALSEVIRDFDFVLNMSSYHTELTAVRAAINAGVNYCDLFVSTTARDRLDSAAKNAGVTAITGVGLGGGLINTLYVYLGSKLDEIMEMQTLLTTTWILSLHLQEVLEASTDADEICRELLVERAPYWGYAQHLNGRNVDAIEYVLTLPWQEPGTANALGLVNGQWQDVDPIHSSIGIPALNWGEPPMRPISAQTSDSYFPRHGWQTQARRLTITSTGFPVQLNEQIASLAVRIARKEITSQEAAAEVRSSILSNPVKWLLPSSPHQVGFHVLGTKNGRLAKSSATMPGVLTTTNWHMLTGAPLIAAARRVWRNEVESKGVLLAEEIFPFEDFETEVVALLPELLPQGKLFQQSFEYID